MWLRTWRFKRAIGRGLVDVLRAAEREPARGIDPPEVVFEGDPIFPMPPRKVAELAVGVFAYVLSEQGSSLEVDYGAGQMWMECPKGRIELLSVPAPLLVDFARLLIHCMDVGRKDAAPQPFIRLPGGRRLSIERMPREEDSPTRRLRIVGFEGRSDTPLCEPVPDAELPGVHDARECRTIRRGAQARALSGGRVAAASITAAILGGAVGGITAWIPSLQPWRVLLFLAAGLLAASLCAVLQRPKERNALALELRIRGRCPRCGYSLTGLSSHACPECAQPLGEPPAEANHAARSAQE